MYVSVHECMQVMYSSQTDAYNFIMYASMHPYVRACVLMCACVRARARACVWRCGRGVANGVQIF